MERPKVDVLLKHAASTIGEGPHWEESTGKLLYVDILADTVHRYHVETGLDESIKIDGAASLLVPSDVDDTYIVTSRRKICSLDWKTEELTDMVSVPNIGSNDRLNDGKCDAAGRLWAGTMGSGDVPPDLELETGRLYSLDGARNLEEKFGPVTISNGLAWTADNSIMYYIDSIPRQIYTFDFDLEMGTIGNKRVAIDFNKLSLSIDDAGYPDGMAIDQEGKLWIAGYFSNKVMQFDPQTGQKIRHVDIPGRRTTSCCFGGKDYSELFVTCAREGTDEENKKMDPLAGSLFRVSGLGAKGTQAFDFKFA